VLGGRAWWIWVGGALASVATVSRWTRSGSR
jgi:hypothetical protein